MSFILKDKIESLVFHRNVLSQQPSFTMSVFLLFLCLTVALFHTVKHDYGLSPASLAPCSSQQSSQQSSLQSSHEDDASRFLSPLIREER